MSTPRTPDPDRGAAFLGKLLKDDPAHLDVATDEEVVAMMDKAGVSAETVPGAEELFARAAKRAATRAKASTAEPVHVAPPAARSRARRMSPSSIAAAVAAIALGSVALLNRAALVAYLSGGSANVGASVTQRAATLREEALDACDARRWEECGRKLDEAKDLDPAGEDEPRVVAARKAIAEAAKPR